MVEEDNISEALDPSPKLTQLVTRHKLINSQILLAWHIQIPVNLSS
jgi:hypothetical protein